MDTTKKRQATAAMQVAKQRFVKQSHIQKKERQQAKLQDAWAAAKVMDQTRMVANTFRAWRAMQAAAKAAAKAKAAVLQEAQEAGLKRVAAR